ncbi:MAG TPA: glycoside hydrolase family 97 protein [Cyclobacteriaceae bacterium]|nr:glycoside hydrolase family 97 protein [Cyclobacteriaceae bacterium]
MNKILIILLALPAFSFAQSELKCSSPDNRIVFYFKLKADQPTYRIAFKGSELVKESTIGLAFSDGDFKQLKMQKPVARKGKEEYDLVVGKTSHVADNYNEVVIPLKSASKDINIVVRAFNSGVAFRYEFIRSDKDSLILTDERTTFNIAGDAVIKALFLPNYVSSHEGLYTTTPLKQVADNMLMDMPPLFDFGNGNYMAITEAALLDYAGTYLMKDNGILRGMLSPWPGQTSIKVKMKAPHKSPWRVFMIGDRVGALIESNILTSLSDPPKIKDTSWIKPGKTTFPWWNGNIVPDTLNAPGNNFVTQQFHIDFCARNGIEYHSVVEYGLHQWYVDDGVGFAPGPNSDVTRAVPGLDMKEVCDYAHSKGVGVRVWIHWGALYPKIDEAFAQFEKWGLSGMMIDFMDRDDQQMVNIQTEMLEKAARHHLHVQFHGAYKPTGLHRTYPNELTREGTLNYEVDKWTPEGLSPDHDLDIVFSRMLAGSTDYHLGGFRAATKEKFRMQYSRPQVLGTRCHMMAMYVVLESYLGMVCDYPEAYEGQPGFEFVSKVPTIWDETRVLDAKVGEYVVIARRKGNEWFVGGITNSQTRELNINLSMIGDGSHTATVYTDAADASTEPNHISREERQVTRLDPVKVKLAPGGGFCIVVR